jgi:peptidoglycan/LPS O-acetylase OafA/YrhL
MLKKNMKQYKLTEGSSIIIDLIRGVSAQIVVIGHGISFFGIFTFLHEPNFPWIQNIAVLVFFLISGFLISYSTIKKKDYVNYSFSHYFADRFSRIYTAYIPAIFFIFITDLISQGINSETYGYANAFNLRTLIANVLMLQDYPLHNIQWFPDQIKITSFGSGRPLWTLAIEWWIYLSFGYLVLVILKKNTITFFNYLLLFILSVIPLFNLILGRGNGLTTFWIFGLLVFVISTLNILDSVGKKMKILFLFVFSILAVVRAYVVMDAYDAIFAFLLSLAFWLVIDLAKNTKIPVTLTKIIKYNASFSYTLYLTHYTILSFLQTHFIHSINPYILFFSGFILTNVMSVLIGRYTELTLTSKVKQKLYFIINKGTL